MSGEFEAFMAPDIRWLSPPEFLNAWQDLTGDEHMTEAAWTDTTAPIYPAYVNVQLAPPPPAPGDPLGQRTSPEAVILTVRGCPQVRDATPDTPACTTEGPTCQITIPFEEWDQLLAQAQRMRAAPARPTRNEDDLEG